VKFTGKADFAEAKSVPKLRGLLPHLENSYTIIKLRGTCLH